MCIPVARFVCCVVKDSHTVTSSPGHGGQSLTAEIAQLRGARLTDDFLHLYARVA